MKKYIKIFTLIICAMISCFAFCACNEKVEEEIKVNMIELSKYEVNLVVGQSDVSEDEVSFSYAPLNTTQNELEVFGYDEKVIDVNVLNSEKKITIKAKEINTSSEQTYIGVRMKGNTNIEKNIKVVVKKTNQKLNTPTNLRYDLENDMIVWDSENEVSDGLNGYVLVINGNQITCPINSYYKDFDRSVVNTVKVKANGLIDELDSEYSQEYKFRIIENVSEFKHKDGVVSWSKVSACDGYMIEIDGHATSVDKDTTELSIIDSLKNPDEYVVTINTVAPQGESDINYFNSQKKELKIKKLYAPSNFKFSGNVLEWSSPDRKYIPEYYLIYDKEDTKIGQTNDISYDIPTEVYSGGDYYFKVKAVGDGEKTLDSDFTIYKSFTKLEKPTGVKIENGKLVWDDSSDNENGYIIKLTGKVDEEFNGVLSRELIDTLVQDGKVVYSLGHNFRGLYKVSIINRGDGLKTSDSEPSDEKEFYKFYAPDAETFEMVDNTIQWTAIENCTSYEITFNQNEQTEILISNTNSCEIPTSFVAGEFSVKVIALGNSESYVSSEFSNSKKGLVLSAPTLMVSNGVLSWSKESRGNGYILVIDNKEPITFGVNETSYVLGSEYATGTHVIKIKAVGINTLNNYLGSVSSSYSNEFQALKLDTPSISLQNGNFKCIMTNGTSYTRINELQENGSYNIHVYANGNNINELNSENSNVLNVWLLPTVDDIRIEKGIVSWNSLAKFNEIANAKGLNVSYQGKFIASYTYFDGIDYVYTEEGEIEHIIELDQNYSIDFGSELYGAGTYEIRVRLVGNTGDSGTLFLNGTDNKIGKGLTTKQFTKLEKPSIEFIDYSRLIQDENTPYIPGTFEWDLVSGALNYEVKVSPTNNLNSVLSENLGSKTSYRVDKEPGTYYIAFQAQGNGSDIIDSGYTEVKQYLKLSPATNVRIDNANSKILWDSIYNNSDGDDLPRVVFLIRINGRNYTPYGELDEADFDISNLKIDNIFNIGNILDEFTAPARDIEKIKEFNYTDELLPGENKIEILTYPLNLGCYIPSEFSGFVGMFYTVYSNDLPADNSTPLIINRLATPQGLRMSEKSDLSEQHTLTWTPIGTQYIVGYQLLIREVVETEDGLKDVPESTQLVTINGTDNCSFNFTQYMIDNEITSGSYIVQVKSLTNIENYLSSDFGEELTIHVLTFDDDQMRIKNGNLNWTPSEGAEKYIFDYKITPSDGSSVIEFTREYDSNTTSLELLEKDGFVAGNYEIKVFVKGLNDSYFNAEYRSFVYLDTVGKTEFNYVKLDMPTNIRIVGGQVVFDKINDETYLNNYRLYVQKVGTSEWDEINLRKFTYYELDKNAEGALYSSGNYRFQVRSDGGIIGLNSEILTVMTPEQAVKLDKTTFYLENGLLKWTGVSNSNGYLVDISGTSFIVDGEPTDSQTEIQVKVSGYYSIDLSKPLSATDGSVYELKGGQYLVKVKTLGTGTNEIPGTYLNSCYTDAIKVVKLDTPKNVRIQNGRIVWDDINSSVQTASGSGLMVYTKLNGASKYTEINAGNIDEFVFDSNYIPGTYSIYLQLKGNTNLKPNAGYTYVVDSSISNELTNVIKLPNVENLKVNYTTDIDSIGTLYFDKLDNSYEDIAYLVRLKVIDLKSGAETDFEFETEENTFILPKHIEGQNKSIELSEGVLIKINVKALGKENYIDSEYVPSEKELELTIPSTPIAVPNVVSGIFTGKVSWNKVDYATNYILKYLYINPDEIRYEDITEQTWNECIPQEIRTTENYAYVTKKGYYKFKIIAIITYVDGKRVDDISQIKPDDNITEIKSNELDYIGIYDYSLFLEGDGQEHPFIIDSVSRFDYIKYNLSANYKISNNLDFKNVKVTPFGSSDLMFTGTLDGNGKILKNITFDDVAEINAIFNYIGNGGVVKDIIIENMSIEKGCYVAAIAGYNYGTIDSCKIGAVYNNQTSKYEYDGKSVLAPISQKSMLYCGGVVAENMGLVINCQNFATIAPKDDYGVVYSGGIVAHNGKNGLSNSNGAIVRCSNYGTIGGINSIEANITSNYSGGVVAYNEGVIDCCSNIGNVYAISKKSSVSIGAFAGGITAYNTKNAIVSNCYNDNSNNTVSGDKFVENSKIYVVNHNTLNNYIGGLIGYNEGRLIDCYTVSSIKYTTDKGSMNFGIICGYCSQTSINNTIWYISTIGSMDNGTVGNNFKNSDILTCCTHSSAIVFMDYLDMDFMYRDFLVYNVSNHNYVLKNSETVYNKKYVLASSEDVWSSLGANNLLKFVWEN